MEILPGGEQPGGNQILHFRSLNKPYWENEYGRLFVQKYLAEATALTSDAEVLKFASDQVTLKGLFIELGVCTGKTINFIAALNPHQKIYGFDSFEGLPEDWVREDKTIPAGVFGFKNPDILPPVLHNVELIKGWFSDSLPAFYRSLQLAESDCIFAYRQRYLLLSGNCFCIPRGPHPAGHYFGFDELYNYPGYEQHEFKALTEFLNKYDLKVRYLAYNAYHEQVAVQVIGNGF